MSRPIADLGFWKSRLERALGGSTPLHHAVYICPTDQWERIEQKHRQLLAKYIGPNESVIDCGCGYGRLPNMMPAQWQSRYLGVDFSPELIDLARQRNPDRLFVICNLLDLGNVIRQRFDWAVLTSIRPMVQRELGGDVWAAMEKQIRSVADKLLYLEYDESSDGFIE